MLKESELHWMSKAHELTIEHLETLTELKKALQDSRNYAMALVGREGGFKGTKFDFAED